MHEDRTKHKAEGEKFKKQLGKGTLYSFINLSSKENWKRVLKRKRAALPSSAALGFRNPMPRELMYLSKDHLAQLDWFGIGRDPDAAIKERFAAFSRLGERLRGSDSHFEWSGGFGDLAFVFSHKKYQRGATHSLTSLEIWGNSFILFSCLYY